ncbi:MAG: histidine phosphatase family protein [Erysipelotrichaceae bacterium]|nr:histidine phosphatase family protein [Erysipelotrichaceae bacterium]
MKIRFYFVRHGETLFNKRGRVSGVSDSPLTKLGVVQAKRAGAALHSVWFDKAFVSPAERCINTAGYILEDQEAEAEIIEDLHEYDFGRLEGSRFTSHPDELKKCFDEMDFSAVDGESRAKCEVRAREVFREIISKCSDQDRVLIVSHGYFEMFLMKTLMNVDIDAFRSEREKENRSPIPNGGIMVFEYEDGEYRMVCMPVESEKYDLPEEFKKVTFYYVRHGETLFNMFNRMQGACDSPLTANGIHQAELARDALKYVDFAFAYTSSSKRARDTAAIITEPHEIKAIPTKLLKEVDFGDYEAVVSDSWREEIMNRHMTETWGDVGGENANDVRLRILEILDLVTRRAKNNENVLLVSHGTFYLNILWQIFNIDRDQYYKSCMSKGKQAMPNGGIFVFEYADGDYRIRELMMSPEEAAERL